MNDIIIELYRAMSLEQKRLFMEMITSLVKEETERIVEPAVSVHQIVC